MRSIRSFSNFALLVSILFFTACESVIKDELVPTLTTSLVGAIRPTTVVGGGIITSDAGSDVTARGVCWSTKTRPTISDNKTSDGTGIGAFTSLITGLKEATTYYVRAYATTSEGTSYGNEYQFKTLVATPTVTDADGNVYQTITIGTQVWMVENLKTTKYKDGTPIPNVTDNAAWTALTTPAYCWYNNDATAYKNTYGALYNWYTVNTGKLAPSGWHVPTEVEWKTLINYVKANLGISETLAQAFMSNQNWSVDFTTNLYKNNNSGFSAIPSGYRYNDGFNSSGEDTVLMGTNVCLYITPGYLNGVVFIVETDNKANGFSVRCIKD